MTETDRRKHERYIRKCAELASNSLESGDLPFGSVLVRNKTIEGEGKNTGLNDFDGHAELNAIRDFLDRHEVSKLQECTLYSNFEPCAMCSFVIRDYGIKEVVFSVASPHLGGLSRWQILTAKIPETFLLQGTEFGPEVMGGILEEENKEMFDKLRWKMHYPFR